MPIQNPLITLCQETKSQESLKSFTETHRRMKTKQGKYEIELIEEMNKPVITHRPVVTHQPVVTQIQRLPPTYYPQRRSSNRNRYISSSYISPSDDDDGLYDWKGRQVVFPLPNGRVQVIGRRTQPGFS